MSTCVMHMVTVNVPEEEDMIEKTLKFLKEFVYHENISVCCDVVLLDYGDIEFKIWGDSRWNFEELLDQIKEELIKLTNNNVEISSTEYMDTGNGYYYNSEEAQVEEL